MSSQEVLDSLQAYLPMDAQTLEFTRDVFPRVLREIKDLKNSREEFSCATSDDIESCAKDLLGIIEILESTNKEPENQKAYNIDDWMKLRPKSIDQLYEISHSVHKSRISFRIGQFLKIRKDDITDSTQLKTQIEEAKEHLLKDKEATISLGEFFKFVNSLQRTLRELFDCDVLDILSKHPTHFQVLSGNRNTAEFGRALETCVRCIFSHTSIPTGRDPRLQSAAIAVVFSMIFVRYDISIFVMTTSAFHPRLASGSTLDESIGILKCIDLNEEWKNNEGKISDVADKLQEEFDFMIRFNEYFECFWNVIRTEGFTIRKCTIL